MDRYLKKLSKVLRNVTRAAKKGFTGATRSMKKLIHRGGNPDAVSGAAPAVPAPNVSKPPRRHRKQKGTLRRVTNAVRRVGKGFRNAITRVFTKKAKHRRRNKKAVVQRGSSENISSPSGASIPGVPPAPPL